MSESPESELILWATPPSTAPASSGTPAAAAADHTEISFPYKGLKYGGLAVLLPTSTLEAKAWKYFNKKNPIVPAEFMLTADIQFLLVFPVHIVQNANFNPDSALGSLPDGRVIALPFMNVWRRPDTGFWVEVDHTKILETHFFPLRVDLEDILYPDDAEAARVAAKTNADDAKAAEEAARLAAEEKAREDAAAKVSAKERKARLAELAAVAVNKHLHALELQIAALKATLDTAAAAGNTENTALTAQLVTLNAQKRELEAEKTRLTDEKADTDTDNVAKQARITELEAKIIENDGTKTDFDRQLREKTEEVRQLTDRLSNAPTPEERDKLKRALKTANQRIKELQKNRTIAADEKRALEVKLENANNDILGLQGQVQALKESIFDTQEKIQFLEGILENNTNTHDREVNNLSIQLDEAKTLAAASDVNKAESDAKIADLESQLAEAKERLEQATKRNDEMVAEIAILTTQLEQKRQELVALTAQIAANDEKHAADKDALQKQIDEANEKTANTEAQLGEARTMATASQTELETFTRDLINVAGGASVVEALKALTAAQQVARESTAALAAANLAAESARASAQEEKTAHEKRLGDDVRAAQNALAAANEANQEMDALKAQIGKLQATGAGNTEALKALRIQLATAEQEKTTAEADASSRKEELDALQGQLDAANSSLEENQYLANQFELANSNIADLEKEVEEAKELARLKQEEFDATLARLHAANVAHLQKANVGVQTGLDRIAALQIELEESKALNAYLRDDFEQFEEEARRKEIELQQKLDYATAEIEELKRAVTQIDLKNQFIVECIKIDDYIMRSLKIAKTNQNTNLGKSLLGLQEDLEKLSEYDEDSADFENLLDKLRALHARYMALVGKREEGEYVNDNEDFETEEENETLRLSQMIQDAIANLSDSRENNPLLNSLRKLLDELVRLAEPNQQSLAAELQKIQEEFDKLVPRKQSGGPVPMDTSFSEPIDITIATAQDWLHQIHNVNSIVTNTLGTSSTTDPITNEPSGNVTPDKKVGSPLEQESQGSTAVLRFNPTVNNNDQFERHEGAADPKTPFARGGGKIDYEGFLFMFHQIGYLFGKIHYHPSIYYLNMVPRDDILGEFVENQTHSISEKRLSNYVKWLQQSPRDSSDSAIVNMTSPVLKGLDKTEFHSTLVFKSMYEEYYKRISVQADDAPLNAAMEFIKDNNAGESIISVRDQWKESTQKTFPQLLYLLKDTIGFLDETDKTTNKGVEDVKAFLDERKKLLQIVAQRCMEILPVYCAIIQLFTNVNLLSKLRSCAQAQNESLLGTYLYLRVDTKDYDGKTNLAINARYQVKLDKLKDGLLSSNRNPANAASDTVQLRDKHETFTMGYIDDTEKKYHDVKVAVEPSPPQIKKETPKPRYVKPRYVKPIVDYVKKNIVNLVGTNNTKPVSAFGSRKRPGSAFDSTGGGGGCTLTKDDCTIRQTQFYQTPAILDSGQIGFEHYDRKYVVGPFSEIFGPAATIQEMANSMSSVITKLDAGEPVMIMGYGVSGAGKTSTLVYYRAGNRKGVVMDLCSAMAKKEWTTVQLAMYEKYDGFDAAANKVPRRFREPVADFFNFTFIKEKGEFTLNIPCTLTHRHPYMFDPTITSTTFDAKKSSLADMLIHMIEFDRFTKSTPNNDQSSRSHVIALITFQKKDVDGKIKHTTLTLGDFAGIENEYSCDMAETLEKLGSPVKAGDFIEVVDNLNDNLGRIDLTASLPEFRSEEREKFFNAAFGNNSSSATGAAESAAENDTKPIFKNTTNKFILSQTGEEYILGKGPEMKEEDKVFKYMNTDVGETLGALDKRYVSSRLRYIPLPPLVIRKNKNEWTNDDNLKQIIRNEYNRIHPLPSTPTVQYGPKRIAAAAIDGIYNAAINGNGSSNATRHYLTMYSKYNSAINHKLPGKDGLGVNIEYAVNDAIKKVKDITSRVLFPSSLGEKEAGGAVLSAIETYNSSTRKNLNIFHNAVTRYFDAWWDPDRYTVENSFDDTSPYGDNSNKETYGDHPNVILNDQHNALRWMRMQRFKNKIKHMMCLKRRAEGSYINTSVGQLRRSIKACVDAKCAKAGTMAIAPILPEMAKDYYPTYSPSGLDISVFTSPTEKSDATVPVSDIMAIVFEEWQVHNPGKSLRDFYEVLYPCIFCVANLSRGVDDPPPVPYIDTAKLRGLVQNYKEVICGQYKASWNEAPQSLKTSIQDEALQRLLVPIVSISKESIQKEFKTACAELVCRVLYRYPGVDCLKTHADKACTAFATLQKQLTEQAKNPSTRVESLYAPLYDAAEILLSEVDKSNASSTMGTLEFLDRAAKYNRVNVMATDTTILKEDYDVLG